MKPLTVAGFAILFFSFCACRQKSEHETNKIFNEGVALNLQSITVQQQGDYNQATELNKKSIEKFKEVFKIDSANPIIRSCLAHSLYVDKQFSEAIFWFEKANKIDGKTAANYRELGLCDINIGEMQKGKSDIDSAFLMDTTKEIRQITVDDLTNIGELAFSYAEDYTKQGDVEKGAAYKKFSIQVLILAYDYDTTRKEFIGKIIGFAQKTGDKETADYYRNLAARKK